MLLSGLKCHMPTNLNSIYRHIDPLKSFANGISCAQVKWAILAVGKNFMAHKQQMDGWSLALSLSLSCPSITQPWHEYKWRAVRSRDWVSVNGFLLGLRQQRTPNGFSLTGFNHVPWYPLKRMQIVNQSSLSLLSALAHLLPPSSPRSPRSSCHHSPCSYSANSSSHTILHIIPTSCFSVISVLICPNIR